MFIYYHKNKKVIIKNNVSKDILTINKKTNSNLFSINFQERKQKVLMILLRLNKK